MRDALIVSALSLVPRNRVARWMGRVARWGPSRWLTRLFVWAYGVDMDEAAQPLSAYPTLEDLFTRRLRDGARPIHPEGLVSPCDGTIAFLGTTRGGSFEVAPGRSLSVQALLGEGAGERDVAVIYLSPKDYHRVHAPLDLQVARLDYRAGTLWPVFPAAVRAVDGLFARNERVVVHATSAHGPHEVVLVGAFGVGRIGLAFDPLLTNARQPAGPREATVPLGRGDNLGVFHLGSTVIVLGPPGTWAWRVAAGEAIRLGAPLASAQSV